MVPGHTLVSLIQVSTTRTRTLAAMEPNHGFPTAKVVAGYDFAGDNADAINNDDRSLIVPDHDPMDTNEHGTHVSGIIAADGVVKGVAPKAKIVIAKISPAGIGSAWTEQIVADMGVHGGSEQPG